MPLEIIIAFMGWANVQDQSFTISHSLCLDFSRMRRFWGWGEFVNLCQHDDQHVIEFERLKLSLVIKLVLILIFDQLVFLVFPPFNPTIRLYTHL